LVLENANAVHGDCAHGTAGHTESQGSRSRNRAGADHPAVASSRSRSHAIIVRHGRFARLLDNRSANGTYLNDRRIVATNIRNGDMITIASLVMQYVEVC